MSDMKSAKSTAIDIIYDIGQYQTMLPRSVFGAMLCNTEHPPPPGVAEAVARVERIIEADRRELLVWAKAL